jgi:protein-S-isoprenylcysteine O-methyltransferase Ste14
MVEDAPLSEAQRLGGTRARPLLGRTLDAGERVIVTCLFAWFVYKLGSDFMRTGSWINIILLGSESAVLVFVLLRRSTADITKSPLDWVLGFAGTTIPLLVVPSGQPLVGSFAIVVLMLGGAALQITAKLFLRRSFGVVAANRGVMVGGPYRIVRHPMYAGYMLTQVGFLLANPTHWNLAVYSLAWAAQLGRILVEERLLLNDTAYRDLVARVPYRLIPRLF